MNQATLYGAPLSLYTGRARSYLIKAGISYRETMPSTEYFRDEIVPKAGGRAGMPTLELEDGSVIRDGVAIVDHFEALSAHQFAPTTPRQNIISLLFDVIGAEGLLRPAMHYRWNFPEQNLEFLKFHFEQGTPPGPNRVEEAEQRANRMRTACMAFGAVPDTFALTESLYHELLEKLNLHFSDHPYLLGNKPCVGDFGLIAPCYGHLGRDPAPLSIMQTKAVRVFRWVERMNRPDADIGEFENQSAGYLADDAVPQTLIEVLRHLAIDFVPETRAAAQCINQWLAEQDSLPAGTEAARGVGQASFTVRGVTISALAQPFRFYLLQRVQESFAALADADKQAVRELLIACDMADILDITLARNIGRANNLEVWL